MSRKIKKNLKQFKIKVKFSSLSEEEKEKLLFQVFDLLLSTNKKTKPENLQLKGHSTQLPTKDTLEKFFSNSFTSAPTSLAND